MDNKKKLIKKAIYALCGIILILILTNPSILFFLPTETRIALKDTWSSIFGDVESIAKVVSFNWVSIFKVIIICLFMFALSNVVRAIMTRIHPKNGRGKSILSMTHSMLTYVIVIVGIVWSLSAIGINLSTIFASIGIVALIIGFAAESLLEDMITGVFLVFDGEFNVGDIIEINGYRGVVLKIGIRATYIKDAGGNIKIVNNSDVRDVLNRSKTSSMAVTEAPIAYTENLEHAETVLQGILKETKEKYPDIFKHDIQYLGVQTLDTSSINLKIAAEVDEAEVYHATRLLNREIKLGFDKNHVEIPFQQVVVHQAKN